MTQALLALRDVRRSYTLGGQTVHALDGVNIDIAAGEYVAIMGQSGSGKSTLMNILGCLDVPSSGELWVGGQDASHLGADALAALRRERFGFIFQRYHLLPHLSAIDNAALPSVYASRPQSERRARATELLARLGLIDRMAHRPNELSGGQQQRVSIARSLMNGGQIILADEPTGALDSQSGAQLLALFDELHAAGHTLILVTHDADVAAHAKRLIELRDGRVLRDVPTPWRLAVAAATDTPPSPQSAAPMASPKPSRKATGAWGVGLSFGLWAEACASAWHALVSNRLRSALSITGVCIGIASVVSIMALASSAQQTVSSGFASFAQGKLSIRLSGNLPQGATAKAFSPEDIASLARLPMVRSVQPVRALQAQVRHSTRAQAINVSAVAPTSLHELGFELVAGRAPNALDWRENAAVVWLTARARDDLFAVSPEDANAQNNRRDDRPKAPDAAGLGETILIDLVAGSTSVPVTVAGIVKKRKGTGFEFDWTGYAYLPDTTYALKIDSHPDVAQIEVLLREGTEPLQAQEAVTHELRALHGAKDFEIDNRDEAFKEMQKVTTSIALVFTGIGAISLLVGGIGVMNIMLVSVSERTREIGIRMAVGARQSDIRTQFLIEAVVLCGAGGLAGVALSAAFVAGLNSVQDSVSLRLGADAIALAVAASSVVGLLFGTLPARRAARMNPVDALARE
jgi:macrolide transport system ATP-binding/permease protein